MTYVEYLKLVRLQTVHPVEALTRLPSHDRQECALCLASQQLWQDTHTDEVEQLHLKFTKRVKEELEVLKAELLRKPARPRGWLSQWYPDLLAQVREQDQKIGDIVWRQTVRHQLLDRLIGEAYLEETSNG